MPPWSSSNLSRPWKSETVSFSAETSFDSEKFPDLRFSRLDYCKILHHSVFIQILQRSVANAVLSAVPSGYPNPTRYPVFLSIPDPTRLSFGKYRVAGNPKHRVLPDISG